MPTETTIELTTPVKWEVLRNMSDKELEGVVRPLLRAWINENISVYDGEDATRA